MELEQLKQEAMRVKRQKKLEQLENDPNTVKPTDTMCILHQEEVELVSDLLFDFIDTKAPSSKKKVALDILKHLDAI